VKQLEIKFAYALDLAGVDGFDFDSETGFECPHPEDVNFLLRLGIGEVGESWSEEFDVQVVTPGNRPRNNPSGRFVLIPIYSFQALKAALLTTLVACERNTWDECLEELRGRFRWEYD
jgi:hypothetical protein